jgi:ferredoxin
VLGVLNRWSLLGLQRRLVGLFRPTVYDAARFYGVGELKRLLWSIAGERTRIVWRSTLFPRCWPWSQARLPWGGFIGMALIVSNRALLDGLAFSGPARPSWVSGDRMMERQKVWIDVARCTGCGACVQVCPVGAMSLVDGKASVDEEACTGCEACVDACPEGAIQPVVQGELVPIPERPAPAVRQPSPLAETAGAVAVATGVGLLAKAGRALAQAVGRWLTRPSAGARPSSATEAPSAVKGESTAGRGRRARHRQRGR